MKYYEEGNLEVLIVQNATLRNRKSNYCLIGKPLLDVRENHKTLQQLPQQLQNKRSCICGLGGSIQSCSGCCYGDSYNREYLMCKE